MITLGGRTRGGEDKDLSYECGYLIKVLLNALSYYVCVFSIAFLVCGFHPIACEVAVGISVLYMVYYEMSESNRSEALMFFTIALSACQITFLLLWINNVIIWKYALGWSIISFVCMFTGWFAARAMEYHEDHYQTDDTSFTEVFLEEIEQGVRKFCRKHFHNTFAAFILFLSICGFTIWFIGHIFFIQLVNWLSNTN